MKSAHSGPKLLPSRRAPGVALEYVPLDEAAVPRPAPADLLVVCVGVGGSPDPDVVARCACYVLAKHEEVTADQIVITDIRRVSLGEAAELASKGT